MSDITMVSNLDDAPDFALKLGQVCAHWANLEWHLFLLYEAICGSPPAVARASFYAVESNRGKREMISGTGSVLFQLMPEASVLDDLLRRIGKAAKQRNKLVHDLWAVASTQKAEVVQLRLTAAGDQHTMEQITLPDMQATAEHINKLAGEINDFRDRIAGKLPPLLEKYRQQPGVALVFGPKGHPPGRKTKGHHARA
jgi:hypothetical protein